MYNSPFKDHRQYYKNHNKFTTPPTITNWRNHLKAKCIENMRSNRKKIVDKLRNKNITAADAVRKIIFEENNIKMKHDLTEFNNKSNEGDILNNGFNIPEHIDEVTSWEIMLSLEQELIDEIQNQTGFLLNIAVSIMDDYLIFIYMNKEMQEIEDTIAFEEANLTETIMQIYDDKYS